MKKLSEQEKEIIMANYKCFTDLSEMASDLIKKDDWYSSPLFIFVIPVIMSVVKSTADYGLIEKRL